MTKLKGGGRPWSKASPAELKAYKKIGRLGLKIEKVHDPVSSSTTQSLVQVKHGETRIVPRANEAVMIVEKYREYTKGEGSVKLSKRIGEVYSGIGERKCSAVLGTMKSTQEANPSFLNKDKPKTVKTDKPMQQHRVDLIDMSKFPVTVNGVKYVYILSVLDIFSRFLWLIPLMDKESRTVSSELYKLYMSWGPPVILQSDQGSEFKGVTAKLCSLLGVRLIHGRPYHPESQGKVGYFISLNNTMTPHN